MSVKNAAPSLVLMSMMVPTSAAPAPAWQANVSEKSPGLIGKLSKAVGHMDQELNAIPGSPTVVMASAAERAALQQQSFEFRPKDESIFTTTS